MSTTPNTEAAFSNYRVRFIKPDIAVVDAVLTVHNVNGPDGTLIPAISIDFFYVAARHGDQAPLRLVAPVKTRPEKIKAMTRITYTKDEPAD